MRRKKGPRKAEEWEEALKGTLNCEKAEYMRLGKQGKCDYKKLLKQINECAIGNLNDALKLFEEGGREHIEYLYRLEILTDTVQNVYFFKDLDFVKKTDREDIERRIKTAIDQFVINIEIPVDNEDAELIYHLCALKRAAGI